MKLFVWEEVLTDYHDGIMFALAESVEDARAQLLAKCDYLPEEDLATEPKVYDCTSPIAFYLWGGG